MFLKNKTNKQFKLYILTFFTITTILALSSSPENLIDANLIKNNLYENILFLKSATHIVIFCSLILITIKQFKKIKLIPNNLICILYFFFLFFQIIGTIDNPQNSIKNLYYIIPELNIILILLIFLEISNKKFLKFYLNSNLIIFFLIFVYFFLTYFKYYLLFDHNFYAIWGYIKNNQEVPRPTGMARLAMIFSAYYFCAYLAQNKKYLFIIIIFNYMIIAFESRIIVFSLLLISLIFILIKEKYSIIKAFKYLILTFFIPFVISNFIDFSKRKILFNNNVSATSKESRILTPELQKLDTFTSNRTRDWGNILKNFDKERVFGYGIHGDRILINQVASNGFLYSLVSGGYFAAIIYCIICVYSLLLVYLALIKKKFNQYSWFASSMIIFFLTRSLVENSFTIISFDFIVFFSSVFYLEKLFFNKTKSKLKFFNDMKY
jgi:hypothetical protein